MKKVLVKLMLATFLLSMPVFSEARTSSEAQPPELLGSSASEFNQSIGVGRIPSRRRQVRRRRHRRYVRRHVRRSSRRHYRVMRRRGRGRSGHDH